MKKKFLLTLLCILSSCGGGGGGGSGSASTCSATKSIFSTWTSREPGNPIFLMQDCSYNVNCQVMFGAPPCDDNRGDFTIFIMNNGRLGLSNCADNVVLDGADWSIGCDNLLRLEYDSDGSVEILE